MKHLKLFIFLNILPAFVSAQNIPACDSLQVECCSFDLTQNTITLIASNYSSYLFDYPGFILYNSDMDTVAIETVNYFGISTEQPHWLNIIHPFSLPFDGILELHVLFYDSLTCTLEVTIPDTVTTNLKKNELIGLKMFPNPVDDILYIDLKGMEPRKNYNLRILDSFGRVKFGSQLSSGEMQIPAGSIGASGFYFVQVMDRWGKLIETRKLLVK